MVQRWEQLFVFGSLNTASNVVVTMSNATFVTLSEGMYVVLALGPLYVGSIFVFTDVILRCESSSFLAMMFVPSSTARDAFISIVRVRAYFLLLLGDDSTRIPFVSVFRMIPLVQRGAGYLLANAIIHCHNVDSDLVLSQSTGGTPVALEHVVHTLVDLLDCSNLTAWITNTHVRNTLGSSGGWVFGSSSGFRFATSIFSLTDDLSSTAVPNTNITVRCTNVSALTVAVTNVTSSVAPTPFVILGLYCGIITCIVKSLNGITIELYNASSRFVVDPGTINTIGFQQELGFPSRLVCWNITIGSGLVSFAFALREVDVLGANTAALKDFVATYFAALIGSNNASNVNITVSDSYALVETVNATLEPKGLSSIISRSSIVTTGTLVTSRLNVKRSRCEHVVFGVMSILDNVTVAGDDLRVRDFVANVVVMQDVVVAASKSAFYVESTRRLLTAFVDPVSAFSSPNGTAISNSWFSMANCTAEGYDALLPCSVAPGCRVDAASRVSLWCVAMRYASSDPWSLVAAGDAVRVGGSFSTVDDAAIGRSGACWLEHTTTKANRALQATGPLISAVALTSAVGGGQPGFAAAALQRSLLAASLALKCGADAGSDEEVPPPSFSDSPTRLEAAGISFGGATDAAVLQSAGATLGNVLLLCGCGCVLAVFGAWRCRRAMPVGGTIQAVDVAVAARLPSSLLWLQALLLQPSVQHGLASMSAAAGNAATVVVGAVGVACFVCPVVIVFAAVFRHRHEVAAIRRPRSQVNGSSCVVRWKARLYWRGWDWRPARRASSTASAGSSACSRSGAVLLATCGAYFQESRRGARYYFMVDAVCGALCGAAAGVSVPAEACMVPAYVVLGVSAVSLALLLVVRPYATLAGNTFTTLNNALTVLCAALALVPSAQGVASGISLFQGVLALAVALSSILAHIINDRTSLGFVGVGGGSITSSSHFPFHCPTHSHSGLVSLFGRTMGRATATSNLSYLVIAICDRSRDKSKAT